MESQSTSGVQMSSRRFANASLHERSSLPVRTASLSFYPSIANLSVFLGVRPFRMFLTEPIVLVLSLLSGFSDALIFMFIQSFALVYKQYNFATFAIGLSFIPIGIGYFLAWLSFIPAIKRNIKERREKPND